jgi:hypothetical protein
LDEVSVKAAEYILPKFPFYPFCHQTHQIDPVYPFLMVLAIQIYAFSPFL